MNGYPDLRLMVISSCTARKSVEASNPLTLDELRDPSRMRVREEELSAFLTPAGQLYTGEQHRHLTRGVRLLRRRYGDAAVEVQIISAGYGLVSEDRPLAPYEATFNAMGRAEADRWAGQLGISQAVRTVIKGYPLAVFLLGASYLRAVRPPIEPARGQRLLFFAKPSEARLLQRRGVTCVPSGEDESRLYGAGFAALKGRMFELLASSLAREGASLFAGLCRDDTASTCLGALKRALHESG